MNSKESNSREVIGKRTQPQEEARKYFERLSSPDGEYYLYELVGAEQGIASVLVQLARQAGIGISKMKCPVGSILQDFCRAQLEMSELIRVAHHAAVCPECYSLLFNEENGIAWAEGERMQIEALAGARRTVDTIFQKNSFSFGEKIGQLIINLAKLKRKGCDFRYEWDTAVKKIESLVFCPEGIPAGNINRKKETLIGRLKTDSKSSSNEEEIVVLFSGDKCHFQGNAIDDVYEFIEGLKNYIDSEILDRHLPVKQAGRQASKPLVLEDIEKLIDSLDGSSR